MKPLIFLFLLLKLSSASAQATFTLHFKKDSHDLDNEARDIISSINNLIRTNYITLIELTGRADSDGDSAANKILSDKRINSVKGYLWLSGNYKISEVSKGEDDPLLPNTGEKNMTENRSVVVRLFNSDKDLNTPASTLRIIDNNFGAPVSNFEFDGGSEICIKTVNKTFIKIPPHAFSDGAGRIITGKVKLSIREFLSYEEMITSGIGMHSGDQVLTSDGFFDLKVTKGEQTLSLRKGKKIELIVPVNDADSSMKYFFGIMNETQKVDWKLSPDKDSGRVTVRKIYFDSDMLYSESRDGVNDLSDSIDSIASIVSLLSLPENEDITSRIILSALHKRSEDKLNRLIKLLNLKNIRFGVFDSTLQLPVAANVYLFKSSTMREINLDDAIFKDYDFSKVNVISFETSQFASSSVLVGIENMNSVINENKSSIINVTQYQIEIPVLRMINCDSFYNVSNTVPVTVKINNINPAAIVQVVFKKWKTVLMSYKDVTSGTFKFNDIPKGESVYLVAMAVYNGQYYFSKKEIIIGSPNEELDLEKVNKEEVKEGILSCAR